MKMIRGLGKRIYQILGGPRIYYFLAGPVYRRVMFETSLELERINQHYLDVHNKVVHQMNANIQEMQRINQHHLELQSQISQQVADEFVKMYKMIDDIKCDRTDEKLNVTIVNELIKIHKSIEVLKHEQNGKK